MKVFSAIILGAGSGDRMSGIDKILSEISGLPAILHSVNAFLEVGIFQNTIIVENADNIAELKRLLSASKYQSVDVVLGGKRRQDSVKIGLDKIRSSDYVMIHDGARPCVSPALIKRG
ncbi:MAG: 2-C-methyl-D-erythritol 4-phosphate cytidylyltransferase, partial [Chloroflexota bacterium]|nr:2-C-methyl-D-erythritol 4-phosphate cytidylyltransferase [Chloroflexota bacterium]MED6295913.1 2-C-methyl-D-erythritol 4-phosphate cytidylyltransferase [Chloroflexota bacterium]